MGFVKHFPSFRGSCTHKTLRSALIYTKYCVTAKILFGKSASASLELLHKPKWGCIMFLRLHSNHAHHGQRGKACGSIVSIGFRAVERLRTIDWLASPVQTRRSIDRRPYLAIVERSSRQATLSPYVIEFGAKFNETP